MYCNQCGYKMKDTANFCKKCGAPVDPTDDNLSEGKRKAIRFLYTYKNRILLIFIGVLLLCGVGIGAFVFLRDGFQEKEQTKQTAAPVKTVSSVDLKESYEMEDNKLSLDPLYATYDDGTMHELMSYDVYIDSILYEKNENVIDASGLYDGKHLVRLEWKQGEQTYEYEKTINLEHKKDTWEKFVDLVGMTGREIASSYGTLGTPEYGSIGDSDWGYAYADVSALAVRVCFPAGLLDREQDYSSSDSQCIEMSASLNTLFYNMESEMDTKSLSKILGITLTEIDGGGCMGALSDGKLIYIGEGQGNVYTPDTTARITVSEEERAGFFERLF